MQLYPTKITFHVALSGALILLTGLYFKSAFVVGMGGAQILAVAFGRAWARLSITHLRASGFEMVWAVKERATQIHRGEVLTLHAELRNRSNSDARATAIRPIASSHLKVRVKAEEIELPAHSSVKIEMDLSSERIGRWGLHGIALEVTGIPLGGEGLYEIPLLFANPHGIEVLPKALARWNRSAKGGRSRQVATAGINGRRRGEGDDLRELRDHVPGDAFKRIAWKASARRGRLLVRETEQSERETVWLVVDVSSEGWAGEAGAAPLDGVAEEVLSEAAFHVSRGNPVGIALCATRVRNWIDPESSPHQIAKIASALSSSATLVDSDRTSLTEAEIAKKVAEHLRPLDPRGLHGIPRDGLDQLADRADEMRTKAPFAPRPPFASTAREQRLRHYLAAFGIEAPPTDETSESSTSTLLDTIDLIARDASRPSTVVVWAPPPRATARIQETLSRIKRHRILLEWRTRDLRPTVDRSAPASNDPFQSAVRSAALHRAEADAARSRDHLRTLGIRFAARRNVRHLSSDHEVIE